MAVQDKERKSVCNDRETLKQIICFFFFGLQIVYAEVVIIAAPDILSGSSLATSSVIIMLSLPNFLVMLIVPWFMHRISYLKRIVIIVLICLSGLILVVTAAEPQWRLVGVMVLSTGSSAIEITFLAMTAHYEEVTVSAFVAGQGFSSVLVPLLYTGLTTWTCVSPRMAITMTIPAVLFIFVFYAILIKGQDQKQTQKESQGVTYTALHARSDPESRNESDPELSRKEPDPKSREKSFLGEQFATARAIYPCISFLFVLYYAEYLANQAVITTVAFENSPFVPRDHYQYYGISYHFGKFLGRTHILIATGTCPAVLPYIRIRRTWILAAVELGHLLFFLFCSWYRIVPHVAFIVILCATEGFTAGSMYVNSAMNIDELIPETRKKEFGLGLLMVGTPAGSLTAGLMGLYVEPKLMEHCVHNLHLGQLCLTRYASERGWTNARSCT